MIAIIRRMITRIKAIKMIMLYASVGGIIYFSITIKNGIFNEIFGDKLLKKLKRNK